MFQIASFKIICTDSTEILFSKLTSAGLNYHSFHFSLSNKHCLLTFLQLKVQGLDFCELSTRKRFVRQAPR